MLTEFIRYLSAERRYSPLTVRNYKHDVEQFLAWLDCDESRFDPRSVTTEQIREWIIFRTEEGKLSAGSMNREVASLRAFFRWLHRTGAVEKDIFRMISTLKTSRRLPAFVPESRMTTIVSECGPDSEDFQTERNSLIILMFYACGLRLAELVGIDRSDFSADYTSLRVRGKGDKQRMVPILEFLREFTKLREKKVTVDINADFSSSETAADIKFVFCVRAVFLLCAAVKLIFAYFGFAEARDAQKVLRADSTKAAEGKRSISKSQKYKNISKERSGTQNESERKLC